MCRQFIIKLRNVIAPVALILATTAGSPAFAQEAFATPDGAVAALVTAVRSDKPADAIVNVLGPDGRDVASSGDDIADQARRDRFLTAFYVGHSLQADGDKQTLVIGKDEYPFPIPLVQADGKWRWDTAAGLDQILTRRIG